VPLNRGQHLALDRIAGGVEVEREQFVELARL
jgi:hypothetical protein